MKRAACVVTRLMQSCFAAILSVNVPEAVALAGRETGLRNDSS